MVHRGAGAVDLAARYLGDRGAAEDLAQGADAVGPDAPGLVGLLSDLSVERLHDLQDVDLLRRPSQRVAALDAAMTAQGFGENNLLVQTADGVREPQNRRVEITFSGAAAPVSNGPCTPQ